MKILLVFTGGTIGSTLQDTHISIDKNKNILKKYEENFELNSQFDIIKPFTILSENSSGITLRTLCETIRDYAKKDYDGIIVTHGTDTLQYTSAALSYTIGNNSLPVCLVSSNYPLEDAKSNGLSNFHAAVLFIEQQLGNGVFIPYQNQDGKIYIHRGTRLLRSDIYSDNLRSIQDKIYGFFNMNFTYLPNKDYVEAIDEIDVLSPSRLTESNSTIILVTVCPGICYPRIEENTRYILLQGYHSGTIDTSSAAAIRFYDNAKSKNIKVYLTGTYSTQNYDTTLKFKELNIIPLYNIPPIAAYIKLWLADSNGINIDQILPKSLGGDIS